MVGFFTAPWFLLRSSPVVGVLSPCWLCCHQQGRRAHNPPSPRHSPRIHERVDCSSLQVRISPRTGTRTICARRLHTSSKRGHHQTHAALAIAARSTTRQTRAAACATSNTMSGSDFHTLPERSGSSWGRPYFLELGGLDAATRAFEMNRAGQVRVCTYVPSGLWKIVSVQRLTK